VSGFVCCGEDFTIVTQTAHRAVFLIVEKCKSDVPEYDNPIHQQEEEQNSAGRKFWIVAFM
jgi:hypothetical protein